MQCFTFCTPDFIQNSCATSESIDFDEPFTETVQPGNDHRKERNQDEQIQRECRVTG